MENLRRLFCCVLVILASSRAARAQNLMTTGDFDPGAGLSDWTWGPGTLTLGSDSGSCALSDSGLATSELVTNQYFAMYSLECIPVDPVATPVLNIGVLYRTTAAVWGRLFLRLFSDETCSTFLSYAGGFYGETSASWTAIGGAVTLPPTVRAVSVSADFNPMIADIPQFTGSFDRFYVGVLPEVFVDGFEAESGTACPWSEVVP